MVLIVIGIPTAVIAMYSREPDWPDSVVVDGRRYLSLGHSGYEFDLARLQPYRVAQDVDMHGADGEMVFEIAGVDPGEALVMPRLPGYGGDYALLIPFEIVQQRSEDDDYGITGLCLYRVARASPCP